MPSPRDETDRQGITAPTRPSLPRDPTTNRPILPPGPGTKSLDSNRLTREQREFARRVLTGGAEGGQEEYEKNLRRRLLAGLLAPQLEALVLTYMFGRPIERIEVKTHSNPLQQLTPEELRQRALAVAQQINNARLQAEAIDAAPIAPHSAPEDDDA